MKKFEVDLIDGTTEVVEAEDLQGAIAKQAELNAQRQSPPPPQPRPQETFLQNTMDFLGEGAAAFNRSAMEGLDFLGPGTVNAGLRLAGMDYQLPTFAGAHAQTPGAQGGFMDPGTARDATVGFGTAAPAAFGMAPVAGRNLASPVQAGMEFLGLGSAKTPAPLVAGLPDLYGNPVATLDEMIPEALNPSRAARGQMDDMVRSGSEDVSRARYALDPYTETATRSRAAEKAMKQGLSDRFTSMVAASDDATRAKLREMTDIQEGYRNNARFGATNRPSDVAGRSLLDRVSVLKSVNQRARNQFNAVEDALKGQSVDANVAIDKFLSELDGLGLKLDFDDSSKSFLVDAFGSDIEGLDGPVKVIERTLKRLASGEPGQPPDAYDVHRMKRFLDANLSWGQKNLTGVDGNVERILKGLRHDLDAVLDDAFPQYKRVNDEFRETRSVLGELEDAIGKRIDLDADRADTALGTALRPLFGNRVSRQMLTNAVADIDKTAKKYANSLGQGTEVVPFRKGALTSLDETPSLDDDLLTQVMYASELENIFGSAAPNSFLGDLGKATESAAINTAAGGTSAGLATGIGGTLRAGANAVRGINEDAAMQALRELLGMK